VAIGVDALHPVAASRQAAITQGAMTGPGFSAGRPPSLILPVNATHPPSSLCSELGIYASLCLTVDWTGVTACAACQR
jgi:hypothetical protein